MLIFFCFGQTNPKIFLFPDASIILFENYAIFSAKFLYKLPLFDDYLLSLQRYHVMIHDTRRYIGICRMIFVGN